ncbi:zinc knuckle protein [Aphelenchoides avenae]|nr:zinc knuckle protein [Aphelenchus avenae]
MVPQTTYVSMPQQVQMAPQQTFVSLPQQAQMAPQQTFVSMPHQAQMVPQQTFVSMPQSQAQVASQPMFGYSVGMTPTTGGQWVTVGAGSTQQPTYIPSQGVYAVPPQPLLQQSTVPAQAYTVPPPQAQQQSAASVQWTSSSLTPDVPKLQLPVFSGKRSEFRSFWQLFEETVHNKPGVSDAYKMLYLRNLLQGEPEELVKASSTEHTMKQQLPL